MKDAVVLGMTIPHLGRAVWQRSLQPFQAALSLLSGQAFSLLSIRSDLSGWALDHEALALQWIAEFLGITAKVNYGLSVRARQCCHYTSQFILMGQQWLGSRNRISVDYYHGLPGSEKVFTEVYRGLQRHHAALSRVRVSHLRMEQAVLESGIDPGKVHRIPIGINLDYFTMQTRQSRQDARRILGLPESAVVVGSFQKDGIGWGEGMEPKYIKGPDIFLKVVEQLKPDIPELHVLLSGPSRGYIKDGLARLGVPCRHVYPRRYEDVGWLYQTLDLYLVTSRDEGGPKAVLESMASGIPLVTTRVGQAADLIEHERNGWIADIDDVEGLAYWARHVIDRRDSIGSVLASGRNVSESQSYGSQLSLWKKFFTGYVENV